MRLIRRGGLVLLAAVLAVAGCDGTGMFLSPPFVKSASGGDQPDSNGGQQPTPTPTPGTPQSLGAWITAYGDDQADSNANYGPLEYAARVALTRNGSALTGTGTVFRVFREGVSPDFAGYDTLTIQLSGTISGDDATATVQSATGGAVYDTPSWRLRFAGSRMMGMYVSKDISGAVVRSGHALWTRRSTAEIGGSWVTGFRDVLGTTAWPARDRSGAVVLDYNASTNALGGTGTFVEQPDGDAPISLAFNVTRGEAAPPQVTFTLGDMDLADREMDWYGFYSNGLIVGAYAQFDNDNRLVRNGHAAWYSSPTAGPDAVTATWVTAFTDSMAASGHDRSDYVGSATLQAGENNAVTGVGEWLDEGDGSHAFQSTIIQNGIIVGSHVTMDVRVAAGNEAFSWDLRLAGTVMTGCYQHFNGFGFLISRGSGEWRREVSTRPNLVGGWVSAFFDTVSVGNPERSQLALATVSQQADDGTLTGTGSLWYGNADQRRAVFSLVNASITGKDIVWVWRGTDLFGDTTWRLRQAGDFLFGAYTNLNSAGNLESQGSAMWIRTSSQTSNL
jgi:hypothetical protein